MFYIVQFKVRSEIQTGGSIYIQTFGYCNSVYLYSPRAPLPRQASKHGQTDPVYSMHAERAEQKLPLHDCKIYDLQVGNKYNIRMILHVNQLIYQTMKQKQFSIVYF